MRGESRNIMMDREKVDHWLDTGNFWIKAAVGCECEKLARNEAKEQRDIDGNVVLDKVMPENIVHYRFLVAETPDNQLACWKACGNLPSASFGQWR